MRQNFNSWGSISKSQHATMDYLTSRSQQLPNLNEATILTVGNGRCYGDESYNDGGMLIDGLLLDKYIEFNREDGYLAAECGVTLEQILNLIVPCGWFLPVTPGTKFVTLAGAISNDVHGKNHHKHGSFGCFVLEFELLRSDGTRLICSRIKNCEYFYATIGGMGLTGMIMWAKISLTPINNYAITTNAYKFTNLDEYFDLNKVLEKQSTYTVAWVDCASGGKDLGRGIYFTGEHAGYLDLLPKISSRSLNVPITPPFSLMNNVTLRLFNFAYYNRKISSETQIIHYDKFFYPLDAINNWRRIYGPRGFFQYQCVINMDNASSCMKDMLGYISRKNMGSFLSVLKTFGDINSGGMMSFPREGVALALDFANGGNDTLALFDELDKIVLSAKGAIYPAKDARMSEEMFRVSFPRLEEFTQYVDPKFSSNLWRRVYKGNK